MRRAGCVAVLVMATAASVAGQTGQKPKKFLGGPLVIGNERSGLTDDVLARLDDVGLVTEGSDAKLNIDFNNNAEVILKIPGGGFTSLMAATPRPSTRSGFSSSTRLWTAGCASRRRATLAAPGSRWTSSVAPTRWPRCPSPRRSCSGARRRPAWPSPAGAVDTAGRFSGLCRVDDANAKATPIETAVTREQSVGLLRRVRPDQKVRHHTVP